MGISVNGPTKLDPTKHEWHAKLLTYARSIDEILVANPTARHLLLSAVRSCKWATSRMVADYWNAIAKQGKRQELFQDGRNDPPATLNGDELDQNLVLVAAIHTAAIDSLEQTTIPLIQQGEFPGLVTEMLQLDRAKHEYAVTRAIERFQKHLADASGVRDTRAAHSDGFRSVAWYGEQHSFTGNQAKVVQVLWKNWERGTPDVGDETLLCAVDHEAPPARLNVLFRDHSAWGTMIVQGGRRGSHKLSPPCEKLR